MFRGALLTGRGHPATQQVGVQVRYLLDRQVADLDLIGWVNSLPLGDELLGELTRNRALLAGAAFDYQNIGHVVAPSRGVG
ncbi:hypothetical protein D3C80_1682020 [compost metagenome]